MRSHKYSNLFPMMNLQEFNGLKRDIKENGLIEDIITFEGTILDGRNRFKACKESKVKPRFKEYNGNNPLQFVISTNLKRRHLNESQRAVVGSKLATLSLGSNQYGTANMPTQSEAANQLNISERAIRNVKEIQQKAPKRIKEIEDGKAKVGSVLREIKLQEQREQIKAMKPSKELEGVYDVIVIDPPWKYNAKYDPDGRRGGGAYPEMSLEELEKIKIPSEKNCVLWLWVTNKFMKEAHELLKVWGFELKTILTWDKEIMGLGAWLRNRTEHCILAIKGKPYFKNTTWTTLIREKRTTHSTKPETFYNMVDEICAGRKLDYFARKKRKGWDAYGDEVK